MPPRSRQPSGLRGLAALAEGLPDAARPVYLFVGADRREMDEGVALLEHELLDPGLAGLLQARLRGSDHASQDVVDACSTLPFGGGRRLVVLREPERLKGDADALLAYLRDPAPTTCLVVIPTTFDRRLKLSKALEEAACVVSFEPPTGRDLEAWIRARFQRRGLAASAEAVTLLSDLVQAETMLLGNEIEKVALYCAQSKVVERADVEAVLGRTRTIEVFELTNAIEDGDPSAAIAAFRRLAEQGAAVPLLVGMVDWCLGRLLGSERPNAPPARQAALERRRRALAGRGLELYRLLRAADRMFRTTGGNGEAALERAILAAAR